MLPVPETRTARYRPHAARDGLTFGLRPEHLTEARSNGDGHVGLIDTVLDVTEPLGMETLVFFTINGVEICGRVHPAVSVREGTRMTLAAQLDHMHLIDGVGGRVL